MPETSSETKSYSIEELNSTIVEGSNTSGLYKKNYGVQYTGS
jgi:hypothetical protein